MIGHPPRPPLFPTPPLSRPPATGVRNLTAAVLVAWFLLALGGSLLGVFDSEPRPPILLGLATVVPVALFEFCYLTSARFRDRKSTRLNSSHGYISYAVFCLK